MTTRAPTPAARRAKRAAYSGERLAKYLSNAGAWYYSRYAPSVAKLRAWLVRRSNGDAAAVEAAMLALAPLLCEKAVLESRVRAFLERGKSRRFAENRLRMARFDPADVRRALDGYGGEFSDWNTYLPLALRKLRGLLARGKTEREAQAALRAAFPGFARDTDGLVRGAYAGRDGDLDLADAYGAAVRKFGADTPAKRARIFRRLVARGFSTDKVRRVLGESGEGE